MKHTHHIIASACIALSLTACASKSNVQSPCASQTAEARDPRKADELNSKAADILLKQPQEAERILRDALTADLYHGPAHNNLGVVYLNQGKLYEAASEFEWARRLMPGHPDPRINLGCVYEKAGRTEEALASYESALEVYPDHLQATESLVKLQLRISKTDDHTKSRLQDIAVRGESPQWREWAKMQMVRRER